MGHEEYSPEPIEEAVPDSPQSIDFLEERLKALLAPMEQKINSLAEENSKLREELNEFHANGRESNIQGLDFPPNPRAARSVVIATRPVQDAPHLYNQGKGVVDPSGLSINTSSPLSPKNR